LVFFGGLNFVWDVWVKTFIHHEAFNFGSIERVATENLLGGIFWGSFMWLVSGFDKHDPQKRDEPDDKDLPK
jgi:hypothetical protein